MQQCLRVVTRLPMHIRLAQGILRLRTEARKLCLHKFLCFLSLSLSHTHTHIHIRLTTPKSATYGSIKHYGVLKCAANMDRARGWDSVYRTKCNVCVKSVTAI